MTEFGRRAGREANVPQWFGGLRRPCAALEDLAQSGVRHESFSGLAVLRAAPRCAFEELARTTEPSSTEPSGVPDCLEGLAGPVRASN
jgi:hypothetical protein